MREFLIWIYYFMSKRKIADIVRTLRREHALSTVAFANKLGYSPEYIKCVEQETSRTTLMFLRKFANEFNYDYDKLEKLFHHIP